VVRDDAPVRQVLAILSLTVLCSCVANPAPAGAADAHPPCFGAASRDPDVPCVNPRLERSVTPTPAEARRSPNAPCDRVQRRPITVCQFGVARDEAVATVALVGDSHAAHWRGGLEVVARRRRWRGLSITHPSCPLSTARRRRPEPEFTRCLRWNRDVLTWFAGRPDVSVVFVSALSGGSGFLLEPGRTPWETAVAGYAGAWDALPPTVSRIVALRDPPKATRWTAACVVRAVERRRKPGQVCALDRDWGLDRDPLAAAASSTPSERVRLIDLTDVFCDPERCFPVIGGVLVIKDYGHLTALFSTTLAGVLDRAIDGVLTPESPPGTPDDPS
jgi:hypothetical protein